MMNLELLLPNIDWSPFFRSWDLHGKFPDILTDMVVGAQARELFDDAQALLETIIKEQWLTAKARFGLSRQTVLMMILKYMQTLSVIPYWQNGLPCVSSPEGEANRFGIGRFYNTKARNITDYMGCFCVTTGFEHARAKAFEAANDDYNSILDAADRFAKPANTSTNRYTHFGAIVLKKI